MINKTTHRKLKIEQQEHNYKSKSTDG